MWFLGEKELCGLWVNRYSICTEKLIMTSTQHLTKYSVAHFSFGVADILHYDTVPLCVKATCTSTLQNVRKKVGIYFNWIILLSLVGLIDVPSLIKTPSLTITELGTHNIFGDTRIPLYRLLHKSFSRLYIFFYQHCFFHLPKYCRIQISICLDRAK